MEEEKFEMETVKVMLLFDKSMFFRVYDKFDDEVTENQDGSLLVETVMPNNELLISHILSWGDKVEVISPQNIRIKVFERAKKICEKYKHDTALQVMYGIIISTYQTQGVS